MPEERPVRLLGSCRKRVAAPKARWAGELKLHKSTGIEGAYNVADRPMSASRTWAEGPIQAHGGPLAPWPQQIILARERIDEHPNLMGWSRNDTFMLVSDHARMLSPLGRSIPTARIEEPRNRPRRGSPSSCKMRCGETDEKMGELFCGTH